MKRDALIRNALLLILLAGLVFQLSTLVSAYAPRVTEIYKAIGQTGLWRSANFTFGQRTADFYAFLNEHAPASSTVVVPVRAQSTAPLYQQAYVELFVYPRAFEYCENTPQVCIEQHFNLNSTLILTDWQSLETDQLGERLQTFDDDWAVLLPAMAGAAKPWASYSSFQEIILTSLPATLFLLLIFLSGTLIARYTLPSEFIFLHLALGIGSGLGFLTLGLCAALLAGIPLSPGLVGVLPLLGWVAALLVWRIHRREEQTRSDFTRTDWLASVALLAPISLAFVLSVGNGFTETDELILWSAKGFGISLLGFPDGTTLRGTLTTWYPLNLPLIITSFLTLFGERLLESKLVFPFFLVGSAGFVYSYLRSRTQPWIAALGALLLSTAPNIFYMSTLAHGNVPTMFYILGSAVLLDLSQEVKAAQQRIYWAWATLFLILAAWTRPEGIHLAWAIALAALWIYRKRVKQERVLILIILTGVVGYTLFWAIVSPLMYTAAGFTDSAFSIAFAQIMTGDLNLFELGYILYSLILKFLRPLEWGAMGIVTACALVLFLFARSPKVNLLLLGLTVTAAVTAGFWLNTYTFYEGLDLSNWVNTSFIRLVLPGLAVIWLYFFAFIASKYFPKGMNS